MKKSAGAVGSHPRLLRPIGRTGQAACADL